jgi:hypothetical protein
MPSGQVITSPSPQFLDACDQLGMLVMDEAFDMWQEAKIHRIIIFILMNGGKGILNR